MSTAATYYDESEYCDVPAVSSQQWVWPPHSEFGSAEGQIIQFSKRDPSRTPAPAKFRISIQGPTPDWVPSAANKLASIMRLSENWDSYGAKVVTIDSIFAAIHLLVSVMRQATPMPSIVPTALGGVQLEWHQFGIDLEAEILPSGDYLIAYEDEVCSVEVFDEESSSRPTSEFLPLLGYVEQLTQRATSAET